MATLKLSHKARLAVAAAVVDEMPDATIEDARRETLRRIEQIEVGRRKKDNDYKRMWLSADPKRKLKKQQDNKAWLQANPLAGVTYRGKKKDHYKHNKELYLNRMRAWRTNNARYNTSRKLEFNYGITIEQWEALLTSQGGRCAICRTDRPGGKGAWHTDHCHATNKVRGLLCSECNIGLGKFSDSPERLEAAAKYLRR